MFIFFALSLFVSFTKSDDDLLIPSSITIFFRHGDRTPQASYSGSKLTNFPHLGSLTPKGIRQHYYLGKAFARHLEQTNFKFLSDEVYVRSSDVKRCMMSAWSFLHGFRLERDDDKNETFLYNSFPIDVESTKYDTIIRGYSACSVPKTLWDDFLRTDESKEILKDMNLYLENLIQKRYLDQIIPLRVI